MDEYEGGDFTYAPANAGPVDSSGMPRLQKLPPGQTGGTGA
jgi:hypothetical protein